MDQGMDCGSAIYQSKGHVWCFKFKFPCCLGKCLCLIQKHLNQKLYPSWIPITINQNLTSPHKIPWFFGMKSQKISPSLRFDSLDDEPARGISQPCPKVGWPDGINPGDSQWKYPSGHWEYPGNILDIYIYPLLSTVVMKNTPNTPIIQKVTRLKKTMALIMKMHMNAILEESHLFLAQKSQKKISI